MSKKSSRQSQAGPRGNTPYGRGGGALTASTARELHRPHEPAAVGPERARGRSWRDPNPPAPLSGDEIAAQVRRLCDKQGFRLKRSSHA